MGEHGGADQQISGAPLSLVSIVSRPEGSDATSCLRVDEENLIRGSEAI
jgi:hypothetical protein